MKIAALIGMVIIISILGYLTFNGQSSENGRYQAVIQKRYRNPGISYDDDIYILDTKTGNYKKLGN